MGGMPALQVTALLVTSNRYAIILSATTKKSIGFLLLQITVYYSRAKESEEASSNQTKPK